MSANEYLIDASTRHQIMLQRLSGGSFNKLKPLLEKLQKESPTEIGFFIAKKFNKLLETGPIRSIMNR